MDAAAAATQPTVGNPNTEVARSTATDLAGTKGSPAAAAPLAPPPAQAPAERRRAKGPWLVVAIAAMVVVLGLAGGLIFVVTSGHSPSGSKASSASSVSTRHTRQTLKTVAPTSPTIVPVEQQAAQALAALLAQSVADRSAINAASDDVAACGDLSQDAQTFDNAATSRQNLLNSLSTLQNVSSLPPAMIQSLSSAWQASEQVDQDYAGWGEDEDSNGCTPNDTSDENFQAAEQPNQVATQNKMTFATAWNQVATTYNLPQYQWNQL